MSSDLYPLLITAGSLAFIHTIMGPDHYVPFIVMSVSRKWSRAKTAWITLLCGIGHVGSSVVIGGIGIAMGIAVENLKFWEGKRGDWAAWGLIGLGLVYFLWGVRRAYKNKPHKHTHLHGDELPHSHEHGHHHEHAHVHEHAGEGSIAPWALFVVFVLGPCEVLIPVVMYPAAQGSVWGVVLVTIVFGVITIATMMTVVFLSIKGINFLPVAKIQRYVHAIAGAIICLCGVAIHLGL